MKMFSGSPRYQGFSRTVVVTLIGAFSIALGGVAARADSNLQYGFPKIRHVVMVMQEDRSFDDLFQGFPGADTQPFGYTSRGTRVNLRPISLAQSFEISHEARDFIEAFDGGKNDGFNKEQFACGPGKCNVGELPQYSYVPAADVQPYVSIAGQYVLGDRMFGSTYDGDFETHLQLISAQDDMTIGEPTARPWGCDNPIGNGRVFVDRLPPLRPVFPCFDIPTLADEMDSAGVSWRYYAATKFDFGYEWSTFDAIEHVRSGPDWAKVHSDAEFAQDVASGTLADVTWITPTLENSDDQYRGTTGGPDWVASIVNAVGESKFWDSTAIFITWSGWGGFYDHVPPPQDAPQGRSFRVPLIIVSPYVAAHVTHIQYQHGSLLRFAEDAFGLSPLTQLDARANSPDHEFAFSSPPRKFTPIGR